MYQKYAWKYSSALPFAVKVRSIRFLSRVRIIWVELSLSFTFPSLPILEPCEESLPETLTSANLT